MSKLFPSLQDALLHCGLEAREERGITPADQVPAGEPDGNLRLRAEDAGPLRQEGLGHHQHPAVVLEGRILVVRADRQR